MLFDKATKDKLLKEVPGYKLISVSVVSDRMKISGSLARASIRYLEEQKLIKRVVRSSAQLIYTRATASEE